MQPSCILGLFPALAAVGGIQASGRVAWEGICQDARLASQPKQLFCYDPFHEYDWENPNSRVTMASSHLKALWAACTMRHNAPDILVWHISLLRFLPFLRCRNARVTLFLHGIEAWQKQPLWIRRGLSRVSLFLSNSHYTWDKFRAYNTLPASVNYRRVPLGLGEPLSGPTPPAQTPSAVMLGRLLRSEDYKGHREVIEEWPLVLRQISDATLWIVGAGDLQTELEALAQARGLGERVRFWGRVSETQKAELLVQARCLALPSRGEGFGLVYLEAMRLGRPCLVSGLDAGGEVVNPPEAGLAANPQRPHELAAALCRLLSATDEWPAWSRQARSRYENHFTGQSFQERLVTALLTADECAV